jgi:hypothetical protein
MAHFPIPLLSSRDRSHRTPGVGIAIDVRQTSARAIVRDAFVDLPRYRNGTGAWCHRGVALAQRQTLR